MGAAVVTFSKLAAQCPYEQLGLDIGRCPDTHQRLAVASDQSMVAAADVFGQRLFGNFRLHWFLSGKELFEKTAW